MTQELPEPSFEVLVEQLRIQAALQLGQVPNPLTGEAQLAPDRARFTIGLLEALRETTRGNLSGEQSEFLAETLERLQGRLAEIEGA